MFIESEWLKLLFLLGDMQNWLSKMEKDLFYKVPGTKRKKFFRNNCRLSAAVFAHIIERHYHKIPRHPDTGKFTIAVPAILEALRQAAATEPRPMPGCQNFFREADTGEPIGYDRAGQPTSVISIITDANGAVLTAFPGSCPENPASS